MAMLCLALNVVSVVGDNFHITLMGFPDKYISPKTTQLAYLRMFVFTANSLLN